MADIPLLSATADADALAQRLVAALLLPPRARLDAAHVAISAVYGLRFLLTWNCTHLANGALADKIDETCADAGFKAPRILMPQLLMELP